MGNWPPAGEPKDMDFAGFDHVDCRVRDLRAVEPFYDQLMPALGLPDKRYCFVDGAGNWETNVAPERANAVEYYERGADRAVRHFIGFIEDAAMRPTQTRIAFRLPSAADWRSMHGLLGRIGARNVELSADLQAYPAMFFEDPAGTRLEICWR
jgi:catechol 2,3-dioxygenase-like lactoylglutathione lyase family enzyme